MKIREGSQMLGAAELGVLLGVSRQRVSQLTGKEWFPAPVTRLATTRCSGRDPIPVRRRIGPRP